MTQLEIKTLKMLHATKIHPHSTTTIIRVTVMLPTILIVIVVKTIMTIAPIMEIVIRTLVMWQVIRTRKTLILLSSSLEDTLCQ